MNSSSLKYGILFVILVPVAWFLFQETGHEENREAEAPLKRAPAAEDTLRSSASRDSVVLPSVIDQAESIGSVNSLIIRRNGEPVLKEYFHGIRAGRKVNIKSASKSIISLLVGIAVEKGFIDSVSQPIYPYFPDYFDGSREPLKRQITIKDLLTMRSGLETTSFHNYGRWVTSSDWVRYALDQPMVEKPGGKMVYSTGTSHLMSAIITKATGMSTRAFARKHLFDPLDIGPVGWDRGPEGIYMGGNNMSMKPADLMKIGRMLMNGGTWNGERILSMDWLVDSFKTYTRSNYNPYDYGYMWWKKNVGGYQALFAWGYGGQYIFLFPELDSVVVITSFLEGATQQRRYKEPVFDLLENIVTDLLAQEPAVG